VGLGRVDPEVVIQDGTLHLRSHDAKDAYVVVGKRQVVGVPGVDGGLAQQLSYLLVHFGGGQVGYDRGCRQALPRGAVDQHFVDQVVGDDAE